MLRGQAAFFRRGRGGVADRAVAIDVLRDPAEAVLAGRPQMRVVLLHLGGLGGEQLGLGHVDEIGSEMQHERGLDVAGVNAMAGVEGRIEARRQAEPAPLRGGDQHAEPHAQLAPDDADHIVVAAVRIDDDQLAQAGAMHALADLAPDTSEIVRRIRDRAGRAQMLVGFSDRLRSRRNSTRRSSGRRASTVLIMPSAIAVSVMTGRCGPCCSVAATGKIARVELGSRAANSLDLSSAQKRLEAITRSPACPRPANA